MPSTSLDLTGVATYELFLRGTLDKINVYPDLHRIGEYKTAVNTFTEKGYTKPQKEMDESLNRDLYEQIVRGIADGRKKDEAEVRTILDDGTVPAGGRAARGTRGRRGLRRSGGREAARQARSGGRSTARSTAGSARRRSASIADRASP
jgi:protease-4